MRRGVGLILLLAPSFTASLACERSPEVCNAGAFASIVAELEQPHPPLDLETVALRGLKEACPRADPGTIWRLQAWYAGGYAMSEAGDERRFMGFDFKELFRGCKPREKSRRLDPSVPEQRYEACDYGRLGLLNPGEDFNAKDESAFLAYDYFVRHGVEAGLARRFIRRMMFATSTKAGLQRRCRDGNSDACFEFVARHHVKLIQRDRAFLEPLAAELVVVSRDYIHFAGQSLPLRRQENESLSIYPEFAAAIVGAWPQPWVDRSGRRTQPRIAFAVDRSLRVGTLVGLMYTAISVGVEEVGLVAAQYGGLRYLGVSYPRTWVLGPPTNANTVGSTFAWRRQLWATLEDGRVQLGRLGINRAVSPSIELGDGSALWFRVRRLKGDWPHSFKVELRVGRGEEIGGLVDTIRALRGFDCKPPIDGEGTWPPECLFYEVELQL